MYAAIKGGKHIQNRLRAVYNFNGPGFNEDMVKQEEYQNILPKLHTLSHKLLHTEYCNRQDLLQ